MSYATVITRAQTGIDAPVVRAEVHLSGGLPRITIVGLPETAVRESRERVRSALINANFDFPQARLTINLAPADLPKEGGRFDLAIALGVLAASGQLDPRALEGFEFLGELGLDGELRPVTEEDLSALLAWYNRSDIFIYMGRETPITLEEQQIWHATSLSDPASLVWAVHQRDTPSLIGSITLRNLTDRARRAELGVLLGTSGSGFGSDAVQTVLAHAFEVLGIQCVSLEVRGDNRRAITAYMRAGFRPEGILRRRLLKDGTLHDLYSMSILREEFEVADTK